MKKAAGFLLTASSPRTFQSSLRVAGFGNGGVRRFGSICVGPILEDGMLLLVVLAVQKFPELFAIVVGSVHLKKLSTNAEKPGMVAAGC